ncbi:selenocysteine synthase, partial [Acinetobacter baumannii]
MLVLIPHTQILSTSLKHSRSTRRTLYSSVVTIKTKSQSVSFLHSQCEVEPSHSSYTALIQDLMDVFGHDTLCTREAQRKHPYKP